MIAYLQNNRGKVLRMRFHCFVTILTVLCLVLAVSYPAVSADSIYYVSSTGDDENDGERPEDAFATIQKAIDTVSPAGQDTVIIRIAAGTYRENVTLKNGVSLDGGWNSDFTEQWDFAKEGYEPDEAFTVTIDGGGETVQKPCIKVENVQDLTVSGLAIENGRGVQGGGFSIVNSTCTLLYLRFSDNLAKGKSDSSNSGWYAFGDSIFIQRSDVSIENCGFSDHPAEIGGNTIYSDASTLTMRKCDFSDVYREPVVVDGSYSVICNVNVTAEIRDCEFKNNAAFKDGYQVAAIQNFNNSAVVISGCSFEGNDMAVYSHSSNVSISASMFINNGGAAPSIAAIANNGCDPLITNCVFTGNLGSADDDSSGGVMINDDASPQVTNCTFFNNSHPMGNSNLAIASRNGSAPVFTNDIFWCDSCDIIGSFFSTDVTSTVTVTHSDVQGGFDGDGNIDGDPKVDSAASPDLKLNAGSPCIDAGDNTVVKTPAFDDPALDYEGYPRRYDDPSSADTGKGNTPFVDMGAYEYGSSSLTGSLTVTIEEPAPTGAQWQVDGGGWNNSGETQTGLTDGNHTLSYKNITGWTKPANYTVTISAGEEQTVSGKYVQQTGSLTVTIEPSDAVAAGAQWRVGDGDWVDSGETQTGIPVGSQTILFKDVSGWSLPEEGSVEILNDETLTATGTYTLQTGDLKVTIQSPAPDGAQWRVDEGEWHDSGETVSGLSAGNHIVSYKDVSGWTTPDADTVEIKDSALTEITSRLYIQQTGSLKVTILPPDADTAGARWRVDGGAWRGSGRIEPGLTVGIHTVEFEEIADWAGTGIQIVSIEDSQTTEATGEYTKTSGALTVTLEPAGAGTAGAKWRVNRGAWLDSGETKTGLSTAGDHLVEYNSVFGWTTPSPSQEMVTVFGNETTTTSATYVQQTGSLTVTLAPDEAIDAGAQWQLDGGDWQNSGDTIAAVGIGSHTLSFKDVDNWVVPEDQTVSIEEEQTATAIGTYTEEEKTGGGDGGDSGGGCFIGALNKR
jgi:hypothetical protein